MEEEAKESVEFKVDRNWYEQICRSTERNSVRAKRKAVERLREALIEKINFNSSIGQESHTFKTLNRDVAEEVLEEFKAAGFKVEECWDFLYTISWGKE